MQNGLPRYIRSCSRGCSHVVINSHAVHGCHLLHYSIVHCPFSIVQYFLVPDAAQVAGVAFAVLVPPAEGAVGAVAHRHRHRRQRPVLIPLTLIFPAGVTSITVPLPLIDDGADEPDETVTLAIVPLLNAALDGPVVATLTIPDNDVPATPDPETAPTATPDPETAPTATPTPTAEPGEAGDENRVYLPLVLQ